MAKIDYNPNVIRQTIGRYRLTQKLGSGSMGVVYRARDLKKKRPAAIKVLHSFFSEKMIKRFKNEVRILSRLNCPNIVRVYSKTVKKCGDNFYYFPMEFIEGQSLEAILENGPRLPLVKVIPIIRDVCKALEYAHKKGIIHRDLKPGNILLSTESERVCVSDFGLAKAEFELEGNETFSIIGSRLHCSPNKRLDSSKATPASDLFSLGVIMYRMLAGKYPFWTSSEGLLQNLIESGKYTPLSEIRSDLPPRIEKVVDRLLRTDTRKSDFFLEKGYKTASEALNDIYPRKESGIMVFPQWRNLRKAIKRIDPYPDLWDVEKLILKYCKKLECPECESTLEFVTYEYDEALLVHALVFECPCQEHLIPID